MKYLKSIFLCIVAVCVLALHTFAHAEIASVKPAPLKSLVPILGNGSVSQPFTLLNCGDDHQWWQFQSPAVGWQCWGDRSVVVNSVRPADFSLAPAYARFSVLSGNGTISHYNINQTWVPVRANSFFLDTTGVLPNGSSDLTKNIYTNGSVSVGEASTVNKLNVNGSVGCAINVVTASTTLTNAHCKIVVQNGATAVTITLPAATVATKRIYKISRASGSTGTVTIATTSSSIQHPNTGISLPSITLDPLGAGNKWAIELQALNSSNIWFVN